MPTLSRFTRYFIEVAQRGSIRKAAETLHVSASAIDRQILKAEDDLGVKLFERLPGGLRLTAAGELMLVTARQSEKAFQRTLEQLDELQGLRRGHVDIAMIDALSEGFVAAAVAELVGQYPRLTFGLRTANNQDVLSQVLAAEVDFGLLLDPPPSGDLQVRSVTDIPLGIAMPVGHPLSGRSAVQLGDALSHRLLLPAEPLIVHQHAKVLYQRQHVDIQRLTSCNDVRTMRSLIRQGVGVGLLSWLDVASELEAGTLAFVPLKPGHAEPLRLSLCVASHRQLSRAAQLALEAMQARIERIPARL
ncbi:LysR family transcriptional regulator [Phytopseudomonas dryadis]|uniref:LysR family transcriptional regulator n=1 Tax=Phytopseudomonas dryadis TaxID=2487520 RepID=A0A4Q9R1T5_9GAMM|nr:LysR family transcriptional regulator [Pseudomonas dryadis]TBU91965.1 LysR family transcriptional regulator [Pseudomonas dryadis]